MSKVAQDSRALNKMTDRVGAAKIYVPKTIL